MYLYAIPVAGTLVSSVYRHLRYSGRLKSPLPVLVTGFFAVESNIQNFLFHLIIFKLPLVITSPNINKIDDVTCNFLYNAICYNLQNIVTKVHHGDFYCYWLPGIYLFWHI